MATVAELPDNDTLLLLKAKWLIVVYVVPVVFNFSNSASFALVFKKPWTSVFVYVSLCGAFAPNAVTRAPASTSAMLG